MIHYLLSHPRYVTLGMLAVAGVLFYVVVRRAVNAEREAERNAPNAAHPRVLWIVNEESERRERARLDGIHHAYEHDRRN